MAKPHLSIDYQRKHRPAVKKAMKTHSEAHRCPKCNRGSALKKVDVGDIRPAYVCRYADCDYESR